MSGSTNVVLDVRRLTTHCPARERIHVELQEGRDRQSVEVRLTVPLDANFVPERNALEAFGEPRLSIPYAVKIDLCAERANLIGELAKLYQTDFGGKLRGDRLEQLDDAETRAAFADLAKQGASVFHRLFRDIKPRGRYEKHEAIIKGAVGSAFSRPQILAISSSVPLFPWALMYDDPGLDFHNRATLKLDRFCGFHHEIQQEVDGTSALIRLPDQPNLVAAVDRDVDQSGQHSAAGHPFAKLRQNGNGIVDTATAPAFGQALGDFNGDCLYFYGHAGHADPPIPITSWVQFQSVKLTVAELDQTYAAPKFRRELVVAFLNGCRIAPLSEWNEGSLAGFLCGKGRNQLCCITTVAEVPEAFAAEFAREFWDCFLFKRERLGKALLQARLFMLNGPYKNPLGLVYTVFGKVDTQVG